MSTFTPLPAVPLNSLWAPADRRDAAQGRFRYGFALFLLLNVVLFVRPGEVFPDLAAAPIYLIVLAACLAFAASAVLPQLSLQSLAGRPGTACVIGVMAAVVLSHLSHGKVYDARVAAGDFSKILIYFLLLCGLVDSPGRLRRFLVALAVLVFVIAVLTLLQYHGVIQVDALRALNRHDGYDELGDAVTIVQLQACGIFSDPNDFALIIVTSLVVVAHRLLSPGRWAARAPYLVPLAVLLYAFALTKSRGGFLALLAASAAYVFTRFGARRGTVIAVMLLPVLTIVLAGRQTNIDINDADDTAQGRIQLWRDGLQMVRAAPVFGIGYGEYEKQAGLVAHNSYVHGFAELGFFGGTMFLGALALPAVAIRRGGALPPGGCNDELLAWRPCVAGILAGYTAGMMSVTRTYALPTYVVIGAAHAYANLVGAAAAGASPHASPKLLARLAVLAAAVLVALDLFVRTFAK